MKRSIAIGAVAFSLVLAGSSPRPVRGDQIPKEYRKCVDNGLKWLAKQQKKDGHWGANGDQYPVAMTGLAGMALLMEGSTIKSGKYAEHIRRAVHWLMENERTQKNGLISNPNHPSEQGRYMYGHGFGLLFLASVYGDDDNKESRAKLKDVLTRAVKYTGDAQSTQGGWYYTSAKDGHDADEGSVTITQLQALRACKNAGIDVPKKVINNARDYLKKCTTNDGGIVYSLGRGGNGAVGPGRPALTAAAISCGFSAGEYKAEMVKKWIEYCRVSNELRLDNIGAGSRIGHDEYTHYYYAQAIYVLGDKGYSKLFPKAAEKDWVTWTKYKDKMFKFLKESQASDGSWNRGGGWSIGTIYSTSVYLTILQLDKGTLPIYQK
jgi:hypothetical protein